jgi:hypothetical protein
MGMSRIAALALALGVAAAQAQADEAKSCSIGPAASSSIYEPVAPAGGALRGVAWDQQAMKPLDVLSSLGEGGSRHRATAALAAAGPVPLLRPSPLAWALAAVGVLGVLYYRRTVS